MLAFLCSPFLLAAAALPSHVSSQSFFRMLSGSSFKCCRRARTVNHGSRLRPGPRVPRGEAENGTEESPPQGSAGQGAPGD